MTMPKVPKTSNYQEAHLNTFPYVQAASARCPSISNYMYMNL